MTPKLPPEIEARLGERTGPAYEYNFQAPVIHVEDVRTLLCDVLDGERRELAAQVRLALAPRSMFEIAAYIEARISRERTPEGGGG